MALGDRAPVYHNFSLSMDEFMAEFYATVVSEGAWIAKVPEAWKSYLGSLQPIFRACGYNARLLDADVFAPGRCGPRPVSIFWHTFLDQCGGFPVWRSVFSGPACVRFFPEQRNGALFILALMATSPQMLVTGMSSYAMPLHLLFSLIWL